MSMVTVAWKQKTMLLFGLDGDSGVRADGYTFIWSLVMMVMMMAVWKCP